MTCPDKSHPIKTQESCRQGGAVLTTGITSWRIAKEERRYARRLCGRLYPRVTTTNVNCSRPIAATSPPVGHDIQHHFALLSRK